MLTLEKWKNDSILLRLEHVFQKNEDSVLSDPVQLNLEVALHIAHLQNVFTDFTILSVKEVMLGGDRPAADGFTWVQNASDAIRIELKPMEILTFIVHLAAKN